MQDTALEKVIVTIAIGERRFGDMAVNLALSVKTNDDTVKTCVIYEPSAFEGIEELLCFFDYQLAVETDNNKKRHANHIKCCIYKYMRDIIGHENFAAIYLDADTLMLPKGEIAWFKNLEGHFFETACSDVLDLKTGKRTRTDGKFWCNPEAIANSYPAITFDKFPQRDCGFMFFRGHHVYEAYFEQVLKIWNDAKLPFETKAGVKTADFCHNVATMLWPSCEPFQSCYHPVYKQCQIKTGGDEYIYHNHDAIGLDSTVKFDTRIISLYNRLTAYYRNLQGVSQAFYFRLPKKKILNRKIYGYWHIYAVNHWQEVVKEQLAELIKSGLYDASDMIYVGCSGDFDKIKSLLCNHGKFEFLDCGAGDHYEFPTLYILEINARTQQPFYCYYIHAKGVSHKTEPRKTESYWFRKYLQHYVIGRWNDCLQAIKDGCDTAGAQWVGEGEFNRHYRGNFWWADSEYIKTLPSISTLDTTNRFLAEFWIGMGDNWAKPMNNANIDYSISEQVYKREIENG